MKVVLIKLKKLLHQEKPKKNLKVKDLKKIKTFFKKYNRWSNYFRII